MLDGRTETHIRSAVAWPGPQPPRGALRLQDLGAQRGQDPFTEPEETLASPLNSPMVPTMLAVARWCSGNHKAASLAGEKMTRVWARAQRLWPPIRRANGVWIPNNTEGRVRSTLPAKFSHAHRMVCREQSGALPGDSGLGGAMASQPSGPCPNPQQPWYGSNSLPSGAPLSPESRWPPGRTGWPPPGRPERAS